MPSDYPKIHKFPAPPAPEDTTATQIARINELSKTARATWLSLLGYLAFVGVTLLGVQDIDFFDPSRQTQLPLINVAIPTASFFVFAPILGTALFVYLHLYLIRLWDALADPDPTINEQQLSEIVTPWLVNDFGIAMRTDGAMKYRTMYWVSHLVTTILVFAAAPIVIIAFWARHWPSHASEVNIFLAILAAGSVATSLASFYTARKRLRHNAVFKGGYWHLQGIIPWIAITAIFVFISLLKSSGLILTDPEREKYSAQLPIFFAEPVQFPVPNFISRLHLESATTTQPILGLAYADLSEKELSKKPVDWKEYDISKREFTISWCHAEAVPITLCRNVLESVDERKGAENNRKLFCKSRETTIQKGECTQSQQQFRYKFTLDWRNQRLQELKRIPVLDLSGTDLRGANLQNSFLAGAKLDNTDFRGADLTSANLEGVSGVNTLFSQTQDDGTTLLQIKMQNANLVGPQLAGLFFSTFGRFDFGTIQEFVDFDDDHFPASLSFSNFKGWSFENSVVRVPDFGNSYLNLTNLDFATIFTERFPDELNGSSTYWTFFNINQENEIEQKIRKDKYRIIANQNTRAFFGNCNLFSESRIVEIANSINDNLEISMHGWNCS